MNVAHRCCLTLSLFLCLPSNLYGMVVDSRYFPWLPHLYTGTDHAHSSVHVDSFFMTASDARVVSPGVSQDEQLTAYPGFYGILGQQTKRGLINLADVAKSFETAGLANPIPVDWRYIADILLEPHGSLQAQGISIAGYRPITDHFGIGGSTALLRVCGQANFKLADYTKSTITYEAPANEARFTHMMKDFETLAGTRTGYWKSIGLGDIDLYLRYFDIAEYTYACKRLDRSIAAGFIIPTGPASAYDNIAAVPFGGNGHWGWYISPQLEAELKDDWKCGIMFRLQKRFAKIVKRRIPILKESSLFSPIVGDVKVNPGCNFTMSPYIVLEDIRAGLGLQVKYTLTWHDNDEFEDARADKTIPANFSLLRQNETWVQENLTVQLFYDLAHNKDWSFRPIFSCMWDIPTSLVAARGVSNTHRVSIGVTFDF